MVVRLLDGFTGTLQADVYSAYDHVCKENKLAHIGFWDHVRRKFIDAIKSVPAGGETTKRKLAKADVALGYINKLYRYERECKEYTDTQRYQYRQSHSQQLLEEFKVWLDKNMTMVITGSLTRKAMECALNQ